MSNIEWTDTTWNPVTGCSRVSPGGDEAQLDDRTWTQYPEEVSVG